MSTYASCWQREIKRLTHLALTNHDSCPLRLDTLPPKQNWGSVSKLEVAVGTVLQHWKHDMSRVSVAEMCQSVFKEAVSKPVWSEEEVSEKRCPELLSGCSVKIRKGFTVKVSLTKVRGLHNVP